MKLFEQPPMLVTNRALILEKIRENYSGEEVIAINDRCAFAAEDEDGNDIVLIDYEYMLFEQPYPELKFLLQTLADRREKAENEKKKTSIISSAQEADKRTLAERGFVLPNNNIVIPK